MRHREKSGLVWINHKPQGSGNVCTLHAVREYDASPVTSEVTVAKARAFPNIFFWSKLQNIIFYMYNPFQFQLSCRKSDCIIIIRNKERRERERERDKDKKRTGQSASVRQSASASALLISFHSHLCPMSLHHVLCSIYGSIILSIICKCLIRQLLL